MIVLRDWTQRFVQGFTLFSMDGRPVVSVFFLSLSLFSLKFNQIKAKPNKNIELTVDKKNIKK